VDAMFGDMKHFIPAALSFKLIGAAINVWPLKETPEGICLYHQAAILCIDESNELLLFVVHIHSLPSFTSGTDI
jgi:hypothetical protein